MSTDIGDNSKKKRYFKPEDSYVLTDSVIVFIGIGMLLMASLSYSGNVPEEYIFGATLSSFLLILADWILMLDKISNKRMAIYSVFFISGILSFIFTPLIFMGYPRVFELFSSNADVLALLALGFVLMMIGIKSIDYRNKKMEEHREEVRQLGDKIKELNEEITQLKLDID